MRAIWARHSLEWWQERAADPYMPYWFRVAALAFGLHGENGHAPLKHGALSMLLASPDPQTGELVRYRNAARAVRAAIEYGLLAPESTTRCLVVPPMAVKQGEPSRWPKCPVHGNTVPTGRTLSDALGVRSSTHSE